MTRKQVSLLIVIIILSTALSFSLPPLIKKEPSIPTAPSDSAMRVFINNYSEIDNSIDKEMQLVVESRLYSNASQGRNKLYTGVIRPGSYNPSKIYSSEGNIHIKRFMVDVEPSKMTYVVTMRKQQYFQSVTVTCAPKDSQLNKTTPCTESEWL